eukprot:5437737-Pyramimonas_sp.AAC.1
MKNPKKPSLRRALHRQLAGAGADANAANVNANVNANAKVNTNAGVPRSGHFLGGELSRARGTVLGRRRRPAFTDWWIHHPRGRMHDRIGWIHLPR